MLKGMRHPYHQGTNIVGIKLGQPISTFIVFSQSMIKEDHPRKRRELLNNREQDCIRMKVILIIRNNIQSCSIRFQLSYLLLTFNKLSHKPTYFHFRNKNSKLVFLLRAQKKLMLPNMYFLEEVAKHV